MGEAFAQRLVATTATERCPPCTPSAPLDALSPLPHTTRTITDGNRALLGRSAKSTPGMYTCLSGFIDQCEGIEEAVRRPPPAPPARLKSHTRAGTWWRWSWG